MSQDSQRLVEALHAPTPGSWIGMVFPAVNQLRLQLDALDTSSQSNDPNTQLGQVLRPETPIGRERTRNAKKGFTRRDSDQILWEGTALLVGLDEESQRGILATGLPSAFEGTLYEPFTEALGTNMVENARIYEAYLGYGRQLHQQSKVLLGDDQLQFRAVKELAQDANRIDDPETGREPDGVVWATALLIAANHDKEPSIPEELLEFLKVGRYDKFIAETMLQRHFATLSTSPQTIHKPATGLPNLVALTKSLTRQNDQQAITNLLVDNLSLWPPDVRRQLEEEREQLAGHLKLSITAGWHILVEKNCFQLDGSSFSPEQRMIRLRQKVEQLNTKIHNGQGKPLGRSAIGGFKRRNGAGDPDQMEKPVGGTGTGQGNAQEIKLQPRYQLEWLDAKTGDRYPQASENFQEQINDYVRNHGNDGKLRDDIAAIFSAMANFDFSQGVTPGVTKYARPVTINGVGKGVFGFKPFAGSNLSTKTKEANRIRVLFTLEKDTLGILGIARRDKIDRLERALGIASAAKV